jgi:hypothetical protein
LEDGKSKFVALIEFVIGAWRRVGKELSWGFSSERPGCSGRPIRALAGSPTAGQHRGAVCCVVDCGDIKKDRICFSRKRERRDLTEVNFDNTDKVQRGAF